MIWNLRLRIGFMAAMACSLALGCGLVLQQRQALEDAEQRLARIDDLRATLLVANLLSVERGPSNLVLGEEPAPGGPSRQLLLGTRARTDAALEEAATRAGLADRIAPVRVALDQARAEIDALARHPLRDRGAGDVAQAIESMFFAYNAAMPLILVAVATASEEDGALLGRAMVMQMLSRLRDHAGRLGSYLVIAMTRDEPIAPESRFLFERTAGQAEEIWRLVSQITSTEQDTAVSQANAAVLDRFFGHGMPFLRRILQEGETGAYSLNPVEFTAQAVPLFQPLADLREAFVGSTMARLDREASSARRSMRRVSLLTAMALLLEGLVLAAAHRRLSPGPGPRLAGGGA